MQQKIYKWGILGPGKIAKKFAAALDHPLVASRSRLYAVASRDLSRAESFALTYKADKAYGDYDQLINDPDVDIIYIATPHAFHFNLAEACLENHKAVLVEKPLTLNAGQTSRLIAASVKNNTFLMEALWTRFLPMTESILNRIESKELGEIRYIKADFGFPAPYNEKGRLFDPLQGGGSLLDVGIYPLFLCGLLLGDFTQSLTLGKLSGQKIDLNCQAILKYKNGATALIASAIDTQLPITAEITGTRGQIHIPCPWYKNNHYQIKTADSDSWETIQLPPHTNGFEYEISEVITCLDLDLIQSPKWQAAQSLTLARQLDTLMENIGVRHKT